MAPSEQQHRILEVAADFAVAPSGPLLGVWAPLGGFLLVPLQDGTGIWFLACLGPSFWNSCFASGWVVGDLSGDLFLPQLCGDWSSLEVGCGSSVAPRFGRHLLSSALLEDGGMTDDERYWWMGNRRGLKGVPSGGPVLTFVETRHGDGCGQVIHTYADAKSRTGDQSTKWLSR